MKPEHAFFLAAAILALLSFVLLPLSKAAFNKTDLETKAKKAPSVATLEKLRELALIATLVLGAFFALSLYIDAQGGATSTQVSDALKRVNEFSALSKSVSKLVSGLVFAGVFALFAFLWRRSMRAQLMDKMTDAIRRDVDRLNRQTEWDQLEPTEEMRRILTLLQIAYRDFESLGDRQTTERPIIQRRIEELKQHYVSLDLERRIQLNWDAESKPGTGRLRPLLLSPGAFSTAKGTTKWLSRATAVFMIASLIGFQSGAIGEAAEGKKIELGDLQINLSATEAERELDRTHPPQPGQPAPTQQEKQAIHKLSRSFSNNFARAFRPAEHTADPAKARAERARFIVNETGDVQDTAAAFSSQQSPLDEKDLNSVRDYTRAATEPEYTTSTAEAFERDVIARGLHKDPRFKSSVAKLAHEPESASVLFTEVEDFEVEEALGGLIDTAVEHLVNSDIAKTVLKSASEYAKKRVPAMYKSARAKYLMSFFSTGDPAQAASVAHRAAVDLVTDQLRAEIAKLAITPDTLTERLRTTRLRPVVNEFESEPAEDLLRSLPATARKGQETNLANMLSGYESEFPRGSTFSFARDRILRSWNVSDTNSIAERANRALNFNGLRSYSRVGGVLFGRPPQGALPVSATGFSWSTTNGEVQLTILAPAKVEFGPFPASLVYQALRYASDGRPTLLTMMNASAVGRKQVIMHPAFQNTTLGCRLAAADEWIFDYTDPNGEETGSVVRQTLNQLGSALELYKDAIGFINKPGSSRLLPTLPPRFRDEALAGLGLLKNRNPGLSADLLTTVETCVRQASSPWNDCVATSARNQTWVAKLPQTPPQTGFVSQIQEADYSLASGLEAALMPPPNDNLWPLRLTVQMTVDDKQSWEFDHFDPGIVLKGLAADGKLAQWNEVRAICVLQRFFRLAFDGKLGPSFPVERLVLLAKETRAAALAPRCETPKWLSERYQNDVAGVSELRRELKHYLQDAPKLNGAHTSFASACLAALSESATRDQLPRPCVWAAAFERNRRACAIARPSPTEFNNSTSCRVFELAYLADVAKTQYDLRKALRAQTDITRASDLPCARSAPALNTDTLSSLFHH